MKNHLKTVSIVLVLFFLSATTAFAENKCGVNIGPNYSQVSQVASMTNQGGWVVALGTPGNCNDFKDLFGKGLNVVIRAYNGGRTFGNEEALGWVATLGKLDTKGQMVYFMPWNEPNHDNEGGGSTAGNYVYQYSQTLKSALSEAGLLNTKVILLSPMVDKLNPSFGINGSFFNNPDGLTGFYNLFQGSSINEYDQFSPGACSASAPQNNCLYDQLGISSPFYALEAGVVADGCSPPCYKDEQIQLMLNTSWGEKWKDDGNFKMFAIFSYDPHRSDWDIFSTTETKGFYQSTCAPGDVNPGSFGVDDTKKFDQWFSSHQDQLVQCGESCGYAPSLSYCAATAFTPGEEGTGVPPARSGTDSRPFECDACNKTDKMIGSCATSFTVNDQVKYQKKEYGTICENNHWLEKPWGGTIGIDPSGTTIPFVGKKGQESERNYLADYFEGTDKYYYFYQDPIQRLSHSGVWRKLAPKQTQDKLKREMVVRYRSCNAVDLGTHDYQVISESGETAFLSEIANHTPPLETETDYWEKYDAWANSDGGKWARLWTAVPMFSHEDTPGQIVPYVATKIKDNVTYLPPSQIEKVPHVARLYEAAKAVQEILKPSKEESAQSTGNSSVLLAAAEKYSPGEKVLLAEASYDCSHPFGIVIENVSYNGSQLYYGVRLTPNSGDGPQCHLTLNGNYTGGCINQPSSYYQAGASSGTVNPVNTHGDDTYAINASAELDMHYPCGRVGVSASCQVKISGDEVVSTTCGISGPPAPACGLPGASPVDACEKEAIRDTNPNDTLCCSLMKINLGAKDQVKNTDYTPCITLRTCGCEFVDLGYEGNDPREWFCCLGCGENEHGEKVCVQQPSSGCDDWVPFDVNRQVGITLAHPYLSEIWDYTGKDKAGVFNIFRPETNDKFKELDAASSIQYSYSPGTVDPATGSFYFPYLGGIQKAKEWVARTLLPSEQ